MLMLEKVVFQGRFSRSLRKSAVRHEAWQVYLTFNQIYIFPENLEYDL